MSNKVEEEVVKTWPGRHPPPETLHLRLAPLQDAQTDHQDHTLRCFDVNAAMLSWAMVPPVVWVQDVAIGGNEKQEA